ncbi:inovirus-type Gp2 protein [Shewanella intestini]|uniref:Inovirus Gp2 family protein n=1 Tax=Shewanella intestini TaxID=2017544 RepID=A0ABS5I0G0_9GAMM|nr:MULTISPECIES: inovirus-type Gp2 protein [Shewanella]MBR9727509.1 inovirus Gp2 family protein [Shewanella intestini]MRG35341.1 inovirus Gp2 family protein [Shewanella sp. XMDDZSB0408]
MTQITHQKWFEYRDEIWSINSSKSGLRTDILKAILGELDEMLCRHRKVFVWRFDLHLPYPTDDNKLITDFNRRLRKRVERLYDSEYCYAWVREHEKAKSQHYHFALILNGSKVNHYHQLAEWVRDIWEYHGSVFIGDAGGRHSGCDYHNLERDNHQAIDAASYHISYMAKPRGKGYRPKQTKDFGSSRLAKPNKC